MEEVLNVDEIVPIAFELASISSGSLDSYFYLLLEAISYDTLDLEYELQHNMERLQASLYSSQTLISLVEFEL
jgi:hypothetical protein